MGDKTKVQVSKLKPGRYIIIDGEPCRIVNITVSSPGKHGSAKARIEAVGIFDKKVRSIVKPTSAEVDVPIIDKRVGQVIAIRFRLWTWRPTSSTTSQSRPASRKRLETSSRKA